MPAINFSDIDRVVDTGILELDNPQSVATAVVNGTTYLFVASLSDDGVQAFSVANNGNLTAVDQVTDDGSLELDGAIDVATALVSGTTYLFVAANTDDGVQVFSVANSGSLTAVDQVTDSGSLELDGVSGLATAVIGGTTYLFAAARSDNGVQVFSVASNGSLTAVDQVTDDGSSVLAGARDVTTAEIGGTTYLFVAANTDDGVQVYSIAGDGSLTAIDQATDSGSLELDGAWSIETAVVGGNTYLFVSSLVDDGIQVFSVANDGSLTAVDQVTDDGSLLLNGARGITAAEIGGTTYLFAASNADDGVQVFSVANNGTLTADGQIADDATLLLNGASDPEIAIVGSTSYLFVASIAEDGVQVLGPTTANTAPTLSNLDSDTITFTEGDGNTDIDVGGNATVSDDSSDFDAGTLTISYQSGQQAEDRIVLDTSVVTLSAGQTAGSTVTVSGTNIGTIESGSTGGANEGLQITLNSDSNASLVQTLLRSIQYGNEGGDIPTDGNRVLDVVLTDGDGGTSATSSITIDVNPVDDVPTLTGGVAAQSVFQGIAKDLNLSATSVGDVDTASLMVTVSVDTGSLTAAATGAHASGTSVVQTDAQTVTLTGSGSQISTYLDDTNELNFTSAASLNNVTLTVSVSDGVNPTVADTATITVTDGDTPSATTASYNGTEDAAVDLTTAGMAVSQEGAASDALNYITITGITGGTLALGAGANGKGGDGTTDMAAVGAISSGSLINPADIGKLTFTPTLNSTTAGTVTYTVTDTGADTSAAATLTINLAAQNDNPVFTGLPATIAVTEETAGNVDLSAATFSDVDSGSNDITLTLSMTTGGGTLAASDHGGVTVGGTGTATLNLTGTESEIETYLGDATRIQYTGAENVTGNGAAMITVTANDGGHTGVGGGTNVSLGVISVNIINENDAPVVTTSGGTTAFTEDGGALVIDPGLTLSDPDDTVFSSATITVDAGRESTDVLAFTNDNATSFGNIAVDGSYNSATGVLNLVSSGGSATLGQWQNALRAVTFNTTSNTPSEDNRTISFTLTDDDSATSAATSQTVSVAAANDAPVINLPTPPSILEETTDASVGTISVTDGESQNQSITLVVASGTAKLGTTANLTGLSGNDSNSISFAGALVDVNNALASLTYTPAKDFVGTGSIAITSNDGQASDTETLNITVTNINDAPTLTATGGNPTFTEDGAAQDVFNTVSASTVEIGDRIVSMSLTVTNVSDGANEILSFDGSDVQLTNGNSVASTATNGLSVSVSEAGGTATVSFTGATLTSAQFTSLIDGLTYRNTSDNPTTSSNRVVTVTGLTDNGGTANGGADAAAPNITSTVTVAAANDAPVLSNLGNTVSNVIAGAGTPTDVTDLNDVTVTDVDSTDFDGGSLTVSYKSGGTNNGVWGLDGANVAAGTSNADKDATIADNDKIFVGSTEIGSVAANNGGAGESLEITLNVNATVANTQTLIQNLTYSAASGVDTRTYTLTLDDNDGGTSTVSGDFSIAVTPNPPVIDSLDGDSVTWTEGDSAAVLDQTTAATITDSDSSHFNGGNLTVSYKSGGQPEDRLVIDTSGGVSLSSSQDANSVVSVGGNAIGIIQAGSTGGASEGLQIVFNSTDATPAAVQTLVQAIQYDNAGGDAPTDGNRVITISVTDAAGGATGTADVTVNVDPVNDDATITGLPSSLTVTEETTGNLDLSAATFADVDSGSDTVVLTLAVNDGTLSASDAGSVTVGNSGTSSITLSGTAANIEAYLGTANRIQYMGAMNDAGVGADTLTLTANDGINGNIALGTVPIDITNTQDAPTSAGNTLTMNEDTSYTFKAADFAFADVDAGDSLASIAITATNLQTGDTLLLNNATVTLNTPILVADIPKLVFKPVANANGAARLTFDYTVNDGNADSASATMTVNVTDVAEPVTPTPGTGGNSGGSNTPEPVVVRAIEDPDGSDDTIAGANLDDTIEAGGGDDTVTGGDGRDSLSGGDGNDMLDGGNDDDFIDAGVGDDSVDGGVGQDSLFGGAGNDTVIAGDGDDFVKAGVGDLGDDVISGNQGDDTLGGGAGSDTVSGGTGADLLWGREGDDTLDGGDGDDVIYNGDGNDTVIGGEGNDTLWASGGDDQLTGGDGADTFIFGAKSGNDVINDFDKDQDVLDLSFAGLTDLSSLQSAVNSSTRNGEAGILIDLGANQSIFLVGVNLEDLSTNNVTF